MLMEEFVKVREESYYDNQEILWPQYPQNTEKSLGGITKAAYLERLNFLDKRIVKAFLLIKYLRSLRGSTTTTNAQLLIWELTEHLKVLEEQVTKSGTRFVFLCICVFHLPA